ncbi:ABC transporter permease [Halovivax cerinus]|uniref:ABC transporter permease n=1 Tax=Halovivax cerinus TaxID=1487865 RepID=A0ABD5NMG6_9EURY|nr:ABC transporter permease [Halovivax cerinus]
MSLFRYVTFRLAQAVPVLIGISIVTFVLANAMPGDPVSIMLQGQEVNEELIEAVESRYGLDEPAWKRYLNFMGVGEILDALGVGAFSDAPAGLLQGDLGYSIHHDMPVTELVTIRAGPTLMLMVSAFSFALATAIPLGILSAKRRNEPTDHASRLVALFGVSTPTFWIGIMLILIFGVFLDVLPTGTLVLPWRGVDHYRFVDSRLDLYVETVRHLVLPMITLGTLQMATVMRLERAEMIDSLQREYVDLARAYGVPERTILRKHAFRPAQLPIITIVGLNLSTALGGAVLTETVFDINGVGRLLIQAIGQLDYQVILGTTMLLGTAFVLGVIVTDIAYAYVDPRVSYGDAV